MRIWGLDWPFYAGLAINFTRLTLWPQTNAVNTDVFLFRFWTNSIRNEEFNRDRRRRKNPFLRFYRLSTIEWHQIYYYMKKNKILCIGFKYCEINVIGNIMPSNVEWPTKRQTNENYEQSENTSEILNVMASGIFLWGFLDFSGISEWGGRNDPGQFRPIQVNSRHLRTRREREREGENGAKSSRRRTIHVSEIKSGPLPQPGEESLLRASASILIVSLGLCIILLESDSFSYFHE